MSCDELRPIVDELSYPDAIRSTAVLEPTPRAASEKARKQRVRVASNAGNSILKAKNRSFTTAGVLVEKASKIGFGLAINLTIVYI